MGVTQEISVEELKQTFSYIHTIYTYIYSLMEFPASGSGNTKIIFELLQKGGFQK